MSRVIKFRFWLETVRQMTYGHNLLECCKVMQGCSQYFTPLQFTGLHDKNGKEIYEGDIVNVTNKAAYNGNKVVVWDDILLCYVLVWADLFNKWKDSQSGTTFLKVSSGIKCEIIGNIYENPELLQEKGGEG